MTCQEIVKYLKNKRNSENIAGMARFGINPRNTLGVPMPVLRALAKEIGRDHQLALQLWDTDIHEARILAGLIGEPGRLDERTMERWVAEFDSWDVCDQVCSNLFDKSRFAYVKAAVWSKRPEEFVRRAGFILMAALSVHDKKAADSAFLRFFPLIEEGARDGRNFVKKAVNWALRQIGKRNMALHQIAVQLATKLSTSADPSSRWVARDALRELTDPGTITRIRKKDSRSK